MGIDFLIKKQANNYKLFQGEINLNNFKKENLKKPLNMVSYIYLAKENILLFLLILKILKETIIMKY
jgi:hypothetical protein